VRARCKGRAVCPDAAKVPFAPSARSLAGQKPRQCGAPVFGTNPPLLPLAETHVLKRMCWQPDQHPSFGSAAALAAAALAAAAPPASAHCGATLYSGHFGNLLEDTIRFYQVHAARFHVRFNARSIFPSGVWVGVRLLHAANVVCRPCAIAAGNLLYLCGGGGCSKPHFPRVRLGVLERTLSRVEADFPSLDGMLHARLQAVFAAFGFDGEAVDCEVSGVRIQLLKSVTHPARLVAPHPPNTRSKCSAAVCGGVSVSAYLARCFLVLPFRFLSGVCVCVPAIKLRRFYLFFEWGWSCFL
jgi:hypothetical protein